MRLLTVWRIVMTGLKKPLNIVWMVGHMPHLSLVLPKVVVANRASACAYPDRERPCIQARVPELRACQYRGGWPVGRSLPDED